MVTQLLVNASVVDALMFLRTEWEIACYDVQDNNIKLAIIYLRREGIVYILPIVKK